MATKESAIKSALRKDKELSTEDYPIKINLLASPVYLVTTQTLDKNAGIEKLNSALEVIKVEIMKEDGGIFTIKMAPKVVSDIDKQKLVEKMERLREENEEVSGDDDDGPLEIRRKTMMIAPKMRRMKRIIVVISLWTSHFNQQNLKIMITIH